MRQVKQHMTRRDFLRISAAAATGAVMAACAPATPVVVEKEVVKEKEVIITATPVPAISGSLKIWVFPLTENDRDWLWNPLMERFHDEFPEIKTDIEIMPWGGRREKMMTAFAAGEPPDIAYVNTDTISLFGRKDVLVPLDDIIDKEVWDDYPERTARGISWEGKRLMIPTLFIVTGDIANKALLEEIGWNPEDPPYTWDDLREVGAKAAEKDYFLYSVSTWSWGNWVKFVWQAGGTCLNDEATESLLDSEPGHDALTFITEMFQNGWVPKEGAVGSAEEAQAPGINYFFQNRQLMGLGNPTIVPETKRQAPDMEVALVPTWKYKEQIQTVGSGCWGIFKGIKSPEAAAEWVRWMVRPENQGFYCSVTAFPPPQGAALKYWIVEPLVREFVELHLPYVQMNQDTNFWWQLQKVIWAPYYQAAVLGQMSVDEALAKGDADITAAIQEELAKEE